MPYNNTQNLAVSIIVYGFPSLNHEIVHVALLISTSSTHFLFHVKEDDDGELSFEMKEHNPDRSYIPYTLVPLATTIEEANMPNLSNLFARVPVPKPAQPGWNCQTWVYDAMLEMEQNNYLRTGWARHYSDEMMELIFRWTAGAPMSPI